MSDGGKILADILNTLKTESRIGVSTGYLDSKAEALCKKYKVKSAFKDYNGYGATICTGINDVAVHGIPSESELLESGQILSIDMGLIYQDYYLDSAITLPIGEVDDKGIKLIEVTKLALKRAIEVAVEGNTVGDVGFVIQNIAKISGFSVITQMTGHGVGRKLHEEPFIPCFGNQGEGIVLKADMTLAIEPMINEGGSEIFIENDGWTSRTLDGSRSAIFEHTIAVGKRRAKILTQ